MYPRSPSVSDAASYFEPDPPIVPARRRFERLAVGDGVDGVEDLHVSRAATEMGAEMRRHAVLGERVALLVDLRLGPHHDPGDAEPALQTPAGGEGVGEALPLLLGDPFERRDRLAVGLGHVVLARHGRLAVDQDRAAAALARRRAAVLR